MKTLLRWTPATLLLLTFVLLWQSAENGGPQGVVSWLMLMGALPYLGGLVLIITLVIALRKRRLTMPLVVTMLVALITIWPYFWTYGLLPPAYPISLDSTEPAATVRLPADAPLLVGWGGDNARVNYHAVLPDQRWAYDLMVEPALTGSDQLTDYGCWGVPVVAPADGTVVVAVNDEIDHVPGRDSQGYISSGGNRVVIEMETGTFLLIGHLQQGSVLVDVGDFVMEGQPIGRCGNSGSTSEPHIHIHHQRQDPRTVADGLAEGLPLYFRDHDGAAMPTGGVSWKVGRGAVAEGVTVQHQP